MKTAGKDARRSHLACTILGVITLALGGRPQALATTELREGLVRVSAAPEAAASAAGMRSRKRVEPAPVRPVTIGSVRYEALPWGKERGLGQDGGFIRAVDAASGKELWVLKVYPASGDASIEEDKQAVFITRLFLAPDGHSLGIESEHGGRYWVDPATRRVSRK